MGFKLNLDLETSNGPSHEVYVRIESLVVNRVTAKARFQLTYWIDKDHATAFNREYVDEEQRNMVGLVQERLLYFEDESSEGIEIIVPHMIEEDIAEERVIEVPIYETKINTKEVPYTSFDENGDEITLLRTVTSEEQIKVGSTEEKRNVINISLVENIYKFGYSKVFNKLKEFFPENKIETV
jgi:hypothetical protein